MALTLGPPVSLDGPLPVSRPYRLLDVATIIDDPDPHWAAGAQIWPYPQDLPETWAICPPDTMQTTKAAGEAPPLPVFGSFQTYLPITCSALTVSDDYAEFIRRATVAFAARESYGVEAEFAKGVSLPLSPYLADDNCVLLNSGAAVGPIEALTLLEQAVGDTGSGGTIHADAATVTAWESTGFTLDKIGSGPGAQLVTRGCGTPVVVGSGYAGAHPAGTGVPSGVQGWAFATGPVQVRRGLVEIVPGDIRQALNRTNNVITYRAERDYLVVWDSVLQAGVLVDRTLTP